jgi:hypothetical protein
MRGGDTQQDAGNGTDDFSHSAGTVTVFAARQNQQTSLNPVSLNLLTLSVLL